MEKESGKYYREKTLDHKFFKTQKHFVNFTMKLLKESNIEHDFISIKNFYLLGWYMSRENVFKRNEIKIDIDSFTWALSKKEHERVLLYLDSFSKIIEEIEKVKTHKIEINECVNLNELFPFYDEVEIFNETVRNSKIKLDDLQKYDKVPGVYFLYNRNKELIYIGKSFNLKVRVEQSIFERKASYYELLATKNHCEANILEPYYISLYSPELNSDFITFDKPSFEISHKYTKSEMFKVFKNKQ